MLLDDFLPQFEFNEVHNVMVAAPPEQVYQAIQELKPADISPLVFWMLNLRTLPAKLLGKPDSLATSAATTFLDQLYAGGFIPLGEQANRETVFGLIGQFWKLTGGEDPPIPIANAEDYRNFDDPAYAKVAANLMVTPVNGDKQTLCSTETRIHVSDPQTRRKFARYWRMISLGSAWIRVLWLRAIKRKAESNH